MNIHYYKSHLKRHGALKTVFKLFSQSLNKLFTLKFRYLIKFDIKALNSKYLAVDDSFQITRLEPAWLSRHVDLKEYQMNKNFLNRAQCKGDVCFGILNNGKVAAYSWYSHKPSKLLKGELELRFNDKYLYVYNVYTHPDYRGRRLLAIGITNAFRELSTLGCDNFISVVAFDNFSSLKSMYRMGWKKVGQFMYIRFFKTQTGFSIGKKKHSGFEVSVVKRQSLKK